VIPPTVALALYGSADDTGSTASHGIPTANLAYQALKWSSLGFMMAVVVLMVMSHLVRPRRVAPAAWLPVLLVGAVICIDLAGQREVSGAQVWALLIAGGCVFGRFSDAVGRVVGASTVLTAGCALLLGLQGSGLAGDWEHGGDKLLLGSSALAGPFSHPSMLGIALALGLPFLGYIQGVAVRLAGYGLVAVALLWSGSRTSMGAAVLGMGVYWVLRSDWVKTSLRRGALGCLLVASIVVPYFGFSNSFMTGRGEIWRVTTSSITDNALIGLGDESLLSGGYFSRMLNGFHPSSAHNMVLTEVVRAGIPAAVLLVVMMALLLSHTFATANEIRCVTSFLVAFFALATVEGITLDRLTGASGPWLVPLVFLLLSGGALAKGATDHWRVYFSDQRVVGVSVG
jgi:hypothetical protein